MATNYIRKHFFDIAARSQHKVLTYSDLPGPRAYPIIGNVLGYKTKDGRRDPDKTLEIWRDLNQAHGSLVRLDVPGREPTVLVFDPYVAEQVEVNFS